MAAFDTICYPGRCQVCGKETDVAVFSSTMGAISFAYCKDCAENGYEPYGVMVSYISCAGSWPDDINEEYQEIVRNNLRFFGKTEEEFSNDVEREFLRDCDFVRHYEFNEDLEL